MLSPSGQNLVEAVRRVANDHPTSVVDRPLSLALHLLSRGCSGLDNVDLTTAAVQMGYLARVGYQGWTINDGRMVDALFDHGIAAIKELFPRNQALAREAQLALGTDLRGLQSHLETGLHEAMRVKLELALPYQEK